MGNSTIALIVSLLGALLVLSGGDSLGQPAVPSGQTTYQYDKTNSALYTCSDVRKVDMRDKAAVLACFKQACQSKVWVIKPGDPPPLLTGVMLGPAADGSVRCIVCPAGQTYSAANQLCVVPGFGKPGAPSGTPPKKQN